MSSATRKSERTDSTIILSNIIKPVFQEPSVALTLISIVKDCCKSIRNHTDPNVKVSESEETVILWDALRFSNKQWETIDLPDDITNNRKIRTECTAIFSVLSYDQRLAKYNSSLEQRRKMPYIGERVRVSDNGMRVCFGTQARIRSSTAKVVQLDGDGVRVEFAALEGGRGRQKRRVVNYNEDSDGENLEATEIVNKEIVFLSEAEIDKIDHEERQKMFSALAAMVETKPKSESKPQVKVENTPRNQFTLPREDIFRSGELPKQRQPERPSINDVARVLRLVSYILYTISTDYLMSSRCQRIAESDDERHKKWMAIMENCQQFETDVVHDINIETICGNITQLCDAWDDIDDLHF